MQQQFCRLLVPFSCNNVVVNVVVLLQTSHQIHEACIHKGPDDNKASSKSLLVATVVHMRLISSRHFCLRIARSISFAWIIPSRGGNQLAKDTSIRWEI